MKASSRGQSNFIYGVNAVVEEGCCFLKLKKRFYFAEKQAKLFVVLRRCKK
jgi:hypothetical protein